MIENGDDTEVTKKQLKMIKKENEDDFIRKRIKTKSISR